MLSDHKPTYVELRDLFACEPHKQQVYDNAVVMQRCWDKLHDVSRFHYAAYIDQLLQNVLVV